MSIAFNPVLLQAIEQLDYRATVGEVASQAGLELNLAQQGLLTLASEAGGHLQVSQSGDMVFLFPRNFRTLLRNRYWQLRWREFLNRLGQIIFYLIRISFGIILVLSIILMMVAIAAILIALSSRDGDGGGRQGDNNRGGGFFFLPTDIFWLFSPQPDYSQRRNQSHQTKEGKGLNFLEAIFSFLFGDGNPNAQHEEKRWQYLGNLIRNQGGAIAAEQTLPYLDPLPAAMLANEDYILPVLARFNGYPQVSEQGEIIYYFPELQVSAQQRKRILMPASLPESSWRFSCASSGQVLGAIALGAANLILALMLGNLLTFDTGLEFITLVSYLYPLLLTYAIGFLVIPLGRYFGLQWLNQKINHRNQLRQNQAEVLNNPSPALRSKLKFAQNYQKNQIIGQQDLVYSTDQDLLEQESERSQNTDQEWQKRLDGL